MTLTVAHQQPRFGLKGCAAAGWLEARGINLPQQANAWLTLDEHNRVLRLGRGEYLIEGPTAAVLQSAWQPGLADLYRVPRYDAAFVLAADAAPSLLNEICALDTRPPAMADHVLMTLAAGISVMLAFDTSGNAPVYRLWCDATYGDYMHHTLQEILAHPV